MGRLVGKVGGIGESSQGGMGKGNGVYRRDWGGGASRVCRGRWVGSGFGGISGARRVHGELAMLSPPPWGGVGNHTEVWDR